jgi:hypothetical protein
MGSITGLVADSHRHDDLVVAIDRRLAVVALDGAYQRCCPLEVPGLST